MRTITQQLDHNILKNNRSMDSCVNDENVLLWPCPMNDNTVAKMHAHEQHARDTHWGFATVFAEWRPSAHKSSHRFANTNGTSKWAVHIRSCQTLLYRRDDGGVTANTSSSWWESKKKNVWNSNENIPSNYWAVQAGLSTPLTFAWHHLSPLAAFTSSAYFLHNGRQWICEFYTANFKAIFGGP